MRSVRPHEGKHLTKTQKNKPLPLDLVNNFSVWFLTGIQAGFFFFNNTLMMKHRDAMYYFNKTSNYDSTSEKFLMSAPLLLPPHSFGSNKQNILPGSSLSCRVRDAAVFFHFFTLLCSGRRVSERDRAAVWYVNAQSTTRTPVYGTAMTQMNYGVMKRDAQREGREGGKRDTRQSATRRRPTVRMGHEDN